MTVNEDASAETVEPTGRLADPAQLTADDFDPFVGDTFRVTNQLEETPESHVNPMARVPDPSNPFQEVVDLTLIEVNRYSQMRERSGGFDDRPREPFSLLFECGYSGLMAAQLELSHSQLGKGKLCFGPVVIPPKDPMQPIRTRFLYEVVFG